ncbi:MAG: translesion error-prone DNA polymerase V autoproteolytic subunit [Marinilabiliaceae bacterium]|nr:translesion error-prone DNA polymerase V autoproteolytic subunit [Marinilabiliaceae bacterium]
MEKQKIEFFEPDIESSVSIELSGEVHAGFPSPAQDYTEGSIDLNKELVRHPASTFYARVVGNSMIDEGIDQGDILVVDKSLDPQNGDMAVCYVDNEFALKFIDKRDDKIFLVSGNKNYPDIEILPGSDFVVWGVVTYTIKKRNRRV